MKCIIEQMEEYLGKDEENRIREQEKTKDFNDVIVIPILTFVLGVSTNMIDSAGKLKLALIVLVLLIPLRVAVKESVQIYRELFDNKSVKMQKLWRETKDLYIKNMFRDVKMRRIGRIIFFI